MSESKSFEQQLSQYFKEDNIEVKNDSLEDIVQRKEAAMLAKRKSKITRKFKSKRKKSNKVSRASRKKNR
jgi:hypothetical protein